MQLGMVGLGRMGANLTRRLMRAGHEVVVYDVNPDAIAALEERGAVGRTSLGTWSAARRRARSWVMVPAVFAEETTDDVAEFLGRRRCCD